MFRGVDKRRMFRKSGILFSLKKHRYFTDFYIPKDNLLVECKSERTMEVNFDKNLAKLEAVKALGYKMEIRVYSGKGEVVDIWD